MKERVNQSDTVTYTDSTCKWDDFIGHCGPFIGFVERRNIEYYQTNSRMVFNVCRIHKALLMYINEMMDSMFWTPQHFHS